MPKPSNVLSHPAESADIAADVAPDVAPDVRADVVTADTADSGVMAFAPCNADSDYVTGGISITFGADLAYTPRCLRVHSGARVTWKTADGERSGVTAGIDDRGALLVRDGQRVERIVSGEVTWL